MASKAASGPVSPRDRPASDRALVDAFVARHFGVRGTLRLHRHALGWDLLRAPANVILAPLFLLSRLSALVLSLIRMKRAARWLVNRRLMFRTNVASAVAEALHRDLLSQRPGSQLPDTGQAARLIDDYVSVRSAVGEIVTTSLILVLGFTVFHIATPGILSLAPAMTEHAARSTAIADFFLGQRLGGVWYDLFPVELPVWWVIATGVLLAMSAALVTTFAGLIADPIQSWLGIHRRRLLRLLTRLDIASASTAPAPEHLIARSADLVDAALNLWRLLRP